MASSNALRAHVDALDKEANLLKKEMDKLEAAHDRNRITIVQLDKEFASAKFAEDKLQEELDQAWKKTDSIKNKQRKLNRDQMKLQTEQAEKWSQFKVKVAVVNELRYLCGPYSLPQTPKRGRPADSYDQGPLGKKSKVCSAPAFSIHDDEEYASAAIEKVIRGVQDGGKVEKGFNFVGVEEVKEEKKPKAEIKDEKKPKNELDGKATPAAI